ncbi:hypothetical protein G4Y79_23705 [Phototrophicus methaneseepsis]|uniref:Uncharacterized protein n=1 Tax=Phototrophicus methaneseepsis TaxID=2710758 RepID=A0A7S8E948_9CHLR|nr:hypothetical protein [Phototrophicus methaneseepsis]QPC82656.1 hypothetical protein G4Y79_23705 [Phototrophicus methaneseepsis]
MVNKPKRPQSPKRLIWVVIFVALCLGAVMVAVMVTSPRELTPQQADATQTQLAHTALNALDSLFAEPEATP